MATKLIKLTILWAILTYFPASALAGPETSSESIRLISVPSEYNETANQVNLQSLLSKPKDHKPTLLVLGSYDCDPCWHEMPLLGMLKREFGSGFKLVALWFNEHNYSPNSLSEFEMKLNAKYNNVGLNDATIRPESFVVKSHSNDPASVWRSLGSANCADGRLPKLVLISPNGNPLWFHCGTLHLNYASFTELANHLRDTSKR